MNIETQIQKSLADILASGRVEEMISQKIEKTIDEILKDLLREYSDFGKQLKEAVSSALQINFEQISTLGYQQLVMDIINEKIKESVYSNIAEPIKERLDEVLSPFEKRTYKLSEIIEKYRECEFDSSDDDEMEISLHIEESNYGSVYISFDKEENKDRHRCEYQLSIKKDNDKYIWMFEIRGFRPNNGDLRAGSIHGIFDNFIFNLYASKCPIEIDEHQARDAGHWSRYDY